MNVSISAKLDNKTATKNTSISKEKEIFKFSYEKYLMTDYAPHYR